MKNPIKWAKASVEVNGAKDAALIARKYKDEFIGPKKETFKPHREFFLSAFNWIIKQHPNCMEE